MAPELGDLREIEQLAASDTPSREGAWWIMLQTAESIINCASLRDPVNNSVLPEFWMEATAEVSDMLDSDADRPLPYDDLMQMITYCGDQLLSVVKDPRHNIVKVDTMVMPYRVKNTGAKTMNWLGRQPGKTVKEKLAGKNKMLTQVNEYSYDIRENQVAMMLFRQIMRRVSDRVNLGIKANGYDSVESKQIQQLQRIKKTLRNSPLAEVAPQNHNQANNALLSDKNYSIIWRAYLDMAKYDSHLESNWKKALELYIKSVFLSINAELLSYKDVYVLESRNKVAGLCDLHATYIIGYHWHVPYVLDVSYDENIISVDMYDAPLGKNHRHESEMHIVLSAEENHTEDSLEARHGTPIIWTIADEKKERAVHFADLSGSRAIIRYLINRIFPFAQIEPEKLHDQSDHINGSVSYDIIAGGDQLGIEADSIIPVWSSKYAVAYTDDRGIKTFYPGGNRAVHFSADENVIVSDAVTYQNNEGLKAALNEIHNEIILNRDDYFFYLIPDSLEEILQKNLKQCVKAWFSRSFPVWRSVAALTYWLDNPQYTFDDNDIFSYIDLVGDTATVGMLTIHQEKLVKGFVCNHFPPFPQVEEGDYITEDAFCKKYVEAYAKENELDIPERVVEDIVRSGSVKSLMLKDDYANQFVNASGIPSVYQITYEKDLLNKCMDEWLDGIRKFWKAMHNRFNKKRKPSHALFLSDILINLLFQLGREDDLYSVFDENEQEDLTIYQCSSDLILKGALVYKKRLNKHLPTWTEYLPHLSLEVIKDGDYAELELIGDDVSFDVMGEDNEHVVEERLVLKANEKEYSFPLVKQDISRKSKMIDAYIADKSFPLDHDVVVKLFVKYRYGFDNSYELALRPENSEETAFKEIIVEWSNTDRKENVLNIWPPSTNHLEDGVVLMAIDEARASFGKIQASIEKHMVNYVGHNDKSIPIHQTDRFLNGNIFRLRNIVLSDLPEAKEFLGWFTSIPLYKYIGQIAGIYKHIDIPESFFVDNAGSEMDFFTGDCLQVMLSIGSYTPQAIQDYFVKRYFKFDEKTRMKAMVDMLLRNGNNHSAISVIIRDIKEVKTAKSYNIKMYSLIRELGRMCCFDSELIYDFYNVDSMFTYEMVNYIISEVRRMLGLCKAKGDSYYRDFRIIKMYVAYMVALLNFLRLRDPDKTGGFMLLAVGSDDSKKLAHEIRELDDYMSRERPIRPNIRIKLDKPEALSKMSDLSYAIDLYLNGDKKAASIEVVGVDEED